MAVKSGYTVGISTTGNAGEWGHTTYATRDAAFKGYVKSCDQFPTKYVAIFSLPTFGVIIARDPR